MATVNFEFDPNFRENIMKASNKSGSSLKPLFDTVRKVTDEIYFAARDSISKEAREAEGEVQSHKEERFSNTGKELFNRARAKEFALRSAANSVSPTMEYDGKEIFGRVTINRKSSASLEFGGADIVEIGKGTGQYLFHPTYAFLRRALDRIGE